MHTTRVRIVMAVILTVLLCLAGPIGNVAGASAVSHPASPSLLPSQTVGPSGPAIQPPATPAPVVPALSGTRGKPDQPGGLQLRLPVKPAVATGALLNGDFEQGPSVGWEEYSFRGLDIITTTLPYMVRYVTPHSGNWAAWLDRYDHERSYITQTVTIPAGGPFLIFWMQQRSEDTDCSRSAAWVAINGQHAIDYRLCHSGNTQSWARQAVPLAAYAGQDVQISFGAETPNGLVNSLFVDDVSIDETVPPLDHRTYLPVIYRSVISGPAASSP